MKFEKRNGRVYHGNDVVIEANRDWVGCGARFTQERINEAFRCYDEPERPGLPEGWSWDGECALQELDPEWKIRINARGDVSWDDDTTGFNYRLWDEVTEVRRIVVEYNARKRAEPEKPEVDVSKLVEPPELQWACVKDGEVCYFDGSGSAEAEFVWLEPVEDVE